MKLAIVFAAFLAVFATTGVFGKDETSSHGVLCSTEYCDQRKGHFSDAEFGSWKMLTSGLKSTNFFLHFKNIQTAYPSRDLIQVCKWGQGWECDMISSVDEQILVYKNTQYVRIMKAPGVKFQAQYTAGCDIVEGQKIKLNRESDSAWEQPGYCWILIPKIYKQSKNQYTAHSYALMKNIELLPESDIGMYNLLTGEKLLDLTSDSVEFGVDEVVNVEPLEEGIKYQLDGKLSTVFLLEVGFCPAHFCNLIAFDFSLTGMTPYDVGCIKQKYECALSENEKSDACVNLSLKCSAYENLLDGEDDQSITGADIRSFTCPRTASEFKTRFCKLNKKGSLRKCSNFRGCIKRCVMYRIIAPCKVTQSVSTFM